MIQALSDAVGCSPVIVVPQSPLQANAGLEAAREESCVLLDEPKHVPDDLVVVCAFGVAVVADTAVLAIVVGEARLEPCRHHKADVLQAPEAADDFDIILDGRHV